MARFGFFVSAPLARLAAGLGLCMASAAAWAHFPVGHCKALDETTVQCKGGFSDGSSAPGLKLDVISYDEKILVSEKLDKNSTATFKRPPGKFYILFDAGAGHVVEIDHTEIDS